MVVVLALPTVVLGDFATPIELFGRVTDSKGRRPYRVVTCAESQSVKSSGCVISVQSDLRALGAANTIIVAGLEDIDQQISPSLSRALRRAAARRVRIASICTGAFVLASCGLLDGQRATTHWRLAAELSRRYPKALVDPNVLYIDNGRLLTSAGALAGTDLCLHLIRKDHGAFIAATSARMAVAPLERSGGQAQFIRHEPPQSRGSLQTLLSWIERNMGEPLSVAEIAQRQAMSVRSLHRRFNEQTGLTPAQWILRRRVHRAQQLLESTPMPVDLVARTVGFSAPSTFRERFKSIAGISPLRYRQTYRSNGS